MIPPLLIECCRVHVKTDAVRACASDKQGWDSLAHAAAQHKVGPLAFWALGQSCTEIVPPAILETFSREFRQHTKRNLFFASRLAELLKTLRGGGVDAIAFKGPVLAWSIYEAPGLRPMSDLDIAVEPEDAERAIEVLRDSGYVPCYPDTHRRFFDQNGQLPMSLAPVTVDLHWRLAPGYLRGLDLASFTERARIVEVAGQQIRAFCREDLLAFLCAHGAKHGWSSLLWISDVARLVETSTLDWERVISTADKNATSRLLHLGLILAHDKLGAAVPSEVLVRMKRDQAALELAYFVWEMLCASRTLTSSALASFLLRALERRLDKCRLVLGTLQPTPADWECFRIPPSLYPAYYIARPARLAVRFFSRLNPGEGAH